jgi:hypothetical protein
LFLARTVAHTTDVDAMLSSMEPRQFDEWLAMYKIRPWAIEITGSESDDKDESSLAAMRRMAGV